MLAELIGARSLRCGGAAWRGAARRVVAGGRGEPLRCCRKKRETKCAAGGKKVNEGSRLRLSEKLLNRERGPSTSQEGTNQSQTILTVSEYFLSHAETVYMCQVSLPT